ncbi:hypothetical protein GGR34_003294 [Microvirga flocculans]|uniref:Uncharacterized protein n=2 Tax=Microvirga flocculans TaxID=217168 RepID=A0A7W6IHJ8_9HYPH|nr:hypothetical protein [Microvirga flocculans]
MPPADHPDLNSNHLAQREPAADPRSILANELQGRWWLRWADHILPASANLPARVEALFCRLSHDGPLNRLDGSQLRHEIKGKLPLGPDGRTLVQEQKNLELPAALIPHLVLGRVFENGVPVGYVPAQMETIDVPPAGKDDLQSIRQELPGPPPSGWDKKYGVFRVLNRADYLLPDRFDRSACLVIRKGEETFLLPCWEMFRAFYASDPILAEALAEGNWQRALRKLVDAAQTRILEEGRWQVGLQNGVPRGIAAALANLMLNPKAYDAARRIRVGLMQDGEPWALRTPLPNDGTVALAVRSVQLRNVQRRDNRPVSLILQIMAAPWPSAAEITVVGGPAPEMRTGERENESADPVRARPSRWQQAAAAESGDTSGQPDALGWSPPDFQWSGKPPVSRECRVREAAEIQTLTDEGDGAARARESETETSDGIRVEIREKHDRFEELAHAFDELLKRGSITSWQALPAPGGGGMRGSRPVWIFKRIPLDRGGFSNWTDLAVGTRSALICRITAADESFNWIEIEHRNANDGYRSLLARIDEGFDETEAIGRLLDACGRARGVWDNALADSGVSDLLAHCQTWSHSSVAGKLNTARLGVTIRKFVQGFSA